MIEAAMAKAEARVCVGSDRCYALGAPSRLPARCTPQARAAAGSVPLTIAPTGRHTTSGSK
jgi:hypothetical protein